MAENREAEQGSTSSTSEQYRGSTAICVVLGMLFFAVGAYFLLDPSGGEVLGRSIVNMHQMVIGQTAAILGAVFLAAGIRPR